MLADHGGRRARRRSRPVGPAPAAACEREPESARPGRSRAPACQVVRLVGARRGSTKAVLQDCAKSWPEGHGAGGAALEVAEQLALDAERGRAVDRLVDVEPRAEQRSGADDLERRPGRVAAVQGAVEARLDRPVGHRQDLAAATARARPGPPRQRARRGRPRPPTGRGCRGWSAAAVQSCPRVRAGSVIGVPARASTICGRGCRRAVARSVPRGPTGRPGRPRRSRPRGARAARPWPGRPCRAAPRANSRVGAERRGAVDDGDVGDAVEGGRAPPRSPARRRVIASTNWSGPPLRSARRIGPASTSSASASPVAVARGSATSLTTAPTRSTGVSVTTGRPLRSRIGARSANARVVPRRVSRSSRGWTSGGVQRTTQSPSVRSQWDPRRVDPRADTGDRPAQPDGGAGAVSVLLHLQRLGVEPGAVEAGAIRAQPRRGGPRRVGPPRGGGVAA